MTDKTAPPDTTFTPERIRRLMAAKGITQQDLADLLGVHLRAVTYWLSGPVTDSKSIHDKLLAMEQAVNDKAAVELARGTAGNLAKAADWLREAHREGFARQLEALAEEIKSPTGREIIIREPKGKGKKKKGGKRS